MLIYRWMGKCINTSKWRDKWMDDGCLDRWMHRCTYGQMDIWMHGWMDIWMEEWVDVWLGRCMDG
jgi:hypothetical protein